jgi:hypothetical protein
MHRRCMRVRIVPCPLLLRQHIAHAGPIVFAGIRSTVTLRGFIELQT